MHWGRFVADIAVAVRNFDPVVAIQKRLTGAVDKLALPRSVDPAAANPKNLTGAAETEQRLVAPGEPSRKNQVDRVCLLIAPVEPS